MGWFCYCSDVYFNEDEQLQVRYGLISSEINKGFKTCKIHNIFKFADLQTRENLNQK